MSRPDLTTTNDQAAVLINRHPVYDQSGSRLQYIKVRYICGHEESWYSLDMGKGWKPRTNAQLMREHLRITCPIGWRLCKECSGS